MASRNSPAALRIRPSDNPEFLPTTELGITDGPRRFSGVASNLTSAKSGANRHLANILSDFGRILGDLERKSEKM